MDKGPIMNQKVGSPLVPIDEYHRLDLHQIRICLYICTYVNVEKFLGMINVCVCTIMVLTHTFL